MKCLVTGAAGFVGSNLAIKLQELGHDVTALDNFSTGNRAHLAAFEGRVLEANVADAIPPSGHYYDVIFHQAAITDPRYEKSSELLSQNLAGFSRMLALAKAQGARLIYASTASLYGNGPAPQSEDQQKDITSSYALSKLIGDEMASHHFRDMAIVGLRYFNVFGPHEEFKGRAASMVFHLAQQMLAKRRPRIYRFGEQKRDHVYVKDCVAANLKALDAPSGVYNVGTGEATTFNELVAILNRCLGTSYEPEWLDMPHDPATYQMNTQADRTRAKRLLKFETAYSTPDGIADYVSSYLIPAWHRTHNVPT
ncbi:MAG: NAD-dependent epimerase/dehydratase family protein [bacterium]